MSILYVTWARMSSQFNSLSEATMTGIVSSCLILRYCCKRGRWGLDTVWHRLTHNYTHTHTRLLLNDQPTGIKWRNNHTIISFQFRFKAYSNLKNIFAQKFTSLSHRFLHVHLFHSFRSPPSLLCSHYLCILNFVKLHTALFAGTRWWGFRFLLPLLVHSF